MINLRYFCFVVIQLYLKVRALALFYFINLHHYTYITQVSVGDTSGLRFQCPSRCTEVQIYLYNTSGWANIGHFRCIAKNCQNKIHRDSSIHSNPDVSKSSIHRKSKFSSNPDVFQLISRDYTCNSSKSTPAQAGLTSISCEYTRFLRIYFTQSYNNNITFLSEDRSQQLRQHHIVDVVVDGVV